MTTTIVATLVAIAGILAASAAAIVTDPVAPLAAAPDENPVIPKEKESLGIDTGTADPVEIDNKLLPWIIDPEPGTCKVNHVAFSKHRGDLRIEPYWAVEGEPSAMPHLWANVTAVYGMNVHVHPWALTEDAPATFSERRHHTDALTVIVGDFNLQAPNGTIYDAYQCGTVTLFHIKAECPGPLMAHEVGHALGLEHSEEGIMEPSPCYDMRLTRDEKSFLDWNWSYSPGEGPWWGA